MSCSLPVSEATDIQTDIFGCSITSNTVFWASQVKFLIISQVFAFCSIQQHFFYKQPLWNASNQTSQIIKDFIKTY